MSKNKDNIRISMSMTDYLKLKEKIAQLTVFAKSIYKFRHKITASKIEEFYKFTDREK